MTSPHPSASSPFAAPAAAPAPGDAQGAAAFKPMYDVHDVALREARRMYQRVLAGWASDVLMLRRKGGLTPRWRETRAVRARHRHGDS